MVSLDIFPTSDVGFHTTFKVSFDKILPPLGPLGLSPPPVPVPTIVPVSSSFFEANIEVNLDETEAGNTFVARIFGMGDDIYGLLSPESTIVHITLGYEDGASKEVMTGLLTRKEMAAGEQWYEATLYGVDLIFDTLQRSTTIDATFPGEKSPANTVGDIAKAICDAAGVKTQINDPGLALKTFSTKGETALEALFRLARLPTRPFSIQARDGKLWMGPPEKLGTTHPLPITDGAAGQPLTARGATSKSDPMDGRDFEIAGIPDLRPSDIVTLGTDQFRVQSVKHKLERYKGYVCSGRALSVSASLDDAQNAGTPSGSVVARQLQRNLLRRDRNRPSVDIGEINSYTAGAHIVKLDIGHDATNDMASPSIQSKLADKPVAFNDKPIASPFAFFGCGLMTPVYPKMRALLAHPWSEPEDAVCNGFVWTSDMTPPKTQTGDWWLRLPTKIGADGKPSGPVVDDLTTMEGQRVIKVKGMTITIGAGLLSSDERPAPAGDESLTVTAGASTKFTIKDKEITMSDGTVTLTVSNGKVSIA